MKKLTHVLAGAKRTVKKNLPTILSATALAGLGGTCVMVAKETPEANQEETMLKKVWAYKGAIALGAATASCVIFADRINVNRLAKAAFQYNLIATNFQEYKNAASKLLENAGIGAGAVAAEVAANRDIPEKGPELDEEGEVVRLVWDDWLHEYYYTTLSKLYLGKLVLDEHFAMDGFVPVSMFYAETGATVDGQVIAEHLDDFLGWDCNYLIDDNDVPFIPVSVLDNWVDPKTGKTCVYFSWHIDPKEYE